MDNMKRVIFIAGSGLEEWDMGLEYAFMQMVKYIRDLGQKINGDQVLECLWQITEKFCLDSLLVSMEN